LLFGRAVAADSVCVVFWQVQNLRHHKMVGFILEDELSGMTTLHTMLATYCPQVRIQRIGTSIADGVAMLSDPASQPDLVFLDVNLADGVAFVLLSQIAERRFFIIFISGDERYRPNVTWIDRSVFLSKPIDPQQLQQAVMQSAENPGQVVLQDPKGASINNGKLNLNGRLTITTNKGRHYMYVRDVIYLVGTSSYTTFTSTTQAPLTVAHNLGDYAGLIIKLPTFFQVSRQVVVNLRHVLLHEIKDNVHTAVMSNGTRHVISRRRTKRFIECMSNLEPL